MRLHEMYNSSTIRHQMTCPSTTLSTRTQVWLSSLLHSLTTSCRPTCQCHLLTSVIRKISKTHSQLFAPGIEVLSREPTDPKCCPRARSCWVECCSGRRRPGWPFRPSASRPSVTVATSKLRRRQETSADYVRNYFWRFVLICPLAVCPTGWTDRRRTCWPGLVRRWPVDSCGGGFCGICSTSTSTLR